MSDIKLVTARIPVYAYESGRRIFLWGKGDILRAIQCGAVAQAIKRHDGAYRRITLKPEKGAIASRSHRTATVINDDGLPLTWSPNPRFYQVAL